jgi:hypothetical protein
MNLMLTVKAREKLFTLSRINSMIYQKMIVEKTTSVILRQNRIKKSVAQQLYNSLHCVNLLHGKFKERIVIR